MESDKKYNLKEPLFLVRQDEVYFDGHGDDGLGQTWYFITNNTIYNKLDPDAYYDDIEYYDLDGAEGVELELLLEECRCDPDGLHEQDGYHCTATSYSTIPISWQQAETIQLTLDNYEDLAKLWQQK